MAKNKAEKKIFVLDTSVIIYNHNALRTFQEHDVVIPINVLDELDHFTKGNDNKNFEAREFVRILDSLSQDKKVTEWTPIDPEGNRGNFMIAMGGQNEVDAEVVFGEVKHDHKILNVAMGVQAQNPKRKVILVSKDVNLRLKAKALDLLAEDYETGKVKNVENLFKGKNTLDDIDPAVINRIYKDGAVPFEEVTESRPSSNSYFILKSPKNSLLAYFNPIANTFERVEKNIISKIKPRNAEQVFAMHAILNPIVKLVTLQGVAGTGKTLLAIAGALEQQKDYHQVYLARPIVPLSNKDIGFLPGDAVSKVNPYMEPIWDNLKLIQSQYRETERAYKKITELVDTEKIVVTPLAFIRGRSLSNIFFIIDEAQNLTPHEVKTIITRAGEGTKIVFTGDIYQIDTPYLDSQSNGLSYLIHKFRGQDIYAHVTLEKGERSELANLANDLL